MFSTKLLVLPIIVVTCWSNAFAEPTPNAVQINSGLQASTYLPDFASLVRRQGPTVVNIRVFRSKSIAAPDSSPDTLNDSLLPPRESGMGSGFVAAPNGVILTNTHVVANAERIRVKFSDKRELPAQVLGIDPLTDVAVLKVEASNLPTAVLGDSSQLQVGQWVLAIGAPMGLERTATQGIISTLGRTLPNDSYVPFIQTDVPINPGNSGGPLFDVEGRVVGINSQIVTNSGGYMGLSFAIPINTAINVAKQILANGHAAHGWLGVSAQELTVELAKAYGLEAPRGALISEITDSGPAANAGLQLGDIITAMDGALINDSADLPPMIGASQPGTEHILTVLRDGQVMLLTTKVGELGKHNVSRKNKSPIVPSELLGVKVSDLEGAMKHVLELHTGILVVETTEGPASHAGVQAGDILMKLGRFSLDKAANLRGIVQKLPTDKPIPLLVIRQGNAIYVTITIPGRS